MAEVFELTGKDINNYAKDIFKKGVKTVWKATEKRLESKPAVIVEQTQNMPYVIIHNCKETKTNINRIERVFDFNILASVKFSPSSFSGSDLIPTPQSQSYTVSKGSFYGMGRRGSVWKGRGIEWKENR
ncbi:MAG: hypothetical protein ACLFT3_02010 [Cyclobacteriaceae bacterium]